LLPWPWTPITATRSRSLASPFFVAPSGAAKRPFLDSNPATAAASAADPCKKSRRLRKRMIELPGREGEIRQGRRETSRNVLYRQQRRSVNQKGANPPTRVSSTDQAQQQPPLV